MKALFIDTAGWLACADAADPAHGDAVRARDAAMSRGVQFLTTDYVIDETLTLVRLRLGLPAAETWWYQIHGSPRLRCEWIDALRADKARHVFFTHRDKTYSFTDCTSFIVMQELKLRRVLTTDAHFRQAGFEVVPQSRTAAERRRRR